MAAYTGPVFSFEHDWSEPVVERIAFLTVVLRKRDGSEQRIRNRQEPRRTIEYKAFIGGIDEEDERRRFDALVETTQDQEIMVPIWADAVELTAQVNAGATFVDVPPLEGYDYGADAGFLIFWRSPKSFEVLPIDSLNNSIGRVTFTDPTTATWPKGTRVMPAWLGTYDPIASDEVYASDIKHTQIRFEIKVPTVAPSQYLRAIAPTLPVYRSTDVFIHAGMDGTNQRQVERTVTRIDAGVGQFRNDSIQHAPFGSVDCNLELSGRTEIKEYLGWLDMRVGRQKAFWFPTWQQDFANVTAIAAAQFTAASYGYTAKYAHKESRRDIAFINSDDSMNFRRITNSSDDGTLETFTVDSNLPSLTSLERASFLRYCRLDHDEIELTWTTTEDVSVAMKFRELIKTA